MLLSFCLICWDLFSVCSIKGSRFVCICEIAQLTFPQVPLGLGTSHNLSLRSFTIASPSVNTVPHCFFVDNSHQSIYNFFSRFAHFVKLFNIALSVKCYVLYFVTKSLLSPQLYLKIFNLDRLLFRLSKQCYNQWCCLITLF